jgi:hypothetical protein
MTDQSLPWDYQLVNGKCQMVDRFDKDNKNLMPFLSKTRSFPLSYTLEDIKDEFVREFLTPKPILSAGFIKKSQKFIKRTANLDNLFELTLSPLSVDFEFSKDKNHLNFNEYEEV